MSGGEYRHALCIAATHPVFAGHFPGNPLVPAVVMLDEVAQALRAWRGHRLARVREAKFVRPWLPEQQVWLWLSDAGMAPESVRFEITYEDQLLARGIVEGAA